MDWISSIQNAIDYIENHITDDLKIEDIAEKACSSSFYFQRIFNALSGFTVSEYIRNRRLTLAGNELAAKNVKVLDTALKYGYSNPESFARAFLNFHGITPSQAKKNGSELKSFSRLCVQIDLKGGSIMNYKILEKDSFYVIEKVSTQNIDDSVNMNTIPSFWDNSHHDGTIKTLLECTDDKSRIFGICYGNIPSNKKTFDYSIAASCTDDCKIPEGYRINKIPSRTWAIFECTGAMPKAMQNTWHKICSEFFPVSGYEPTCEMDIEVYPKGDLTSDKYKSEIWVTVKKK